MVIVEVDELSFSYAVEEGRQSGEALAPVSFSVEEGAFCLLVGATGSGKTTLLRAMKPELTPVGAFGGSLQVAGAPLVRAGERTAGLSAEESARQVGFVGQDPGAQIVCDTVWHEIAFGLENLGTAPDAMRRRVAEAAHFLGIEPWVRKRTEEISGGQQQLVNLAGVLALRPRLILLDEPTAQLDPYARGIFLHMLGRVSRELGVTVIMATHMPEEAELWATQTVALSPLEPLAPRPQTAACGLLRAERQPGAEAARARDVWTRYERDGAWVLRGLDFSARAGAVHAVVGGNGCGKSTLLKVVAGAVRTQRGSVARADRGTCAYLPQDPKTLFVCDSVAEELAEWRDRGCYTAEDEAAALERFGLAAAAGRHPYDLSGGQQQLLAFAKLSLLRPRLFLLDEPSKGLDPRAAAQLARLVRRAADDGAAVVMATHDLDFAYVVADEVTMLFDGQDACTEPVDGFFSENLVYRPHERARLYGALR